MKNKMQEQEDADSGSSAYRGHSTFLPYVLNRTTSALNANFQMVLHARGLTLIHWRVLAFLRDADGLGVSALANVTGTDQATLSRALTVMEKAGYIVRDSDPMDQRVVVIKLCPAGEKQFEDILPMAWQLHARAIAGFSPEEQHILHQLLNRICDNVLS